MKGEKLLFFSIVGTIMPKGRKKKRGSSLPFTEGVGLSPSVKKPKVITKGERLITWDEKTEGAGLLG